jgi:adenylate cyclase class 2
MTQYAILKIELNYDMLHLMKNVNHEIEIKFEIKNPNLIRKALKNLKAKFFGKVFEKTIRFDTPNDDLAKIGKFLRIKTGFKNVITLKRKIESKKFKEREEIELEISDPEKMEIILKNLGFTKARIMEKYREKWKLNGTEIVIDKLPMGNFIEIEGREKSIKKVVNLLGLDFKNRLVCTYWDLWKDFTRKKGIKNENIVFSAIKRHKNGF